MAVTRPSAFAAVGGVGFSPASGPAYDQQSSGLIYYLDATLGNDSNDGLSPATAWQNADRVNTVTADEAPPGTQFQFKAGETFDTSGSDYLNPIIPGGIIDRYGSGDDPIFDGGGAAGSFCMYFNGDSPDWVINNIRATNAASCIEFNANSGSTSGTVNDCEVDNSTTSAGQGIQVDAGSSYSCTVTLNNINSHDHVDDDLSTHGDSDITVIANNCTFADSVNAYDSITVGTNNSVTFNDCIFSGHSGPAINATTNTTIEPVCNRCTFIQDGSTNNRYTGSGTLNACVFDYSVGTGGQMISAEDGTLNCNNCTFFGGAPGSSTNGLIRTVSGGTLNLNNCAIVGVNQVTNATGGTINADYCWFQDIDANISVDTNTNDLALAANPGTNQRYDNFGDGALLNTPTDFKPQSGSGLIDAGLNTYAPALDYESVAFDASTPNCGAVETTA